MKKNLFIPLLFIYALCSAQQQAMSQEPLKNEVSIRIENIFAKPPLFLSYGAWPFSYYPSNFPHDYLPVQVGLDYKYHFTKSAIRTGIMVGSSKQQRSHERNQQEDRQSVSNYEARLGYEFHRTLDKVELFYGLDLFYSFYKSESENEYVNEGDLISTKSLRTNSMYGVTPLLGIRYYIKPSFSIGTELGYDIGVYTGKYEQERNNDPDDNGWEEEGNISRFGPLGMISINYHF
jgi:hypothetical protein